MDMQLQELDFDDEPAPSRATSVGHKTEAKSTLQPSSSSTPSVSLSTFRVSTCPPDGTNVTSLLILSVSTSLCNRACQSVVKKRCKSVMLYLVVAKYKANSPRVGPNRYS
jgi:hypothetical protein